MVATDLLEKYCQDVVICSTLSCMKRHPNYQAIVDLGEAAIPQILNFMIEGKWGMCVQYLLSEIIYNNQLATENPMQKAQTPVGAGFVATRVEDAANLWIKWGHENGYLTENDPQTVKPESF